MLTLGLRKPIQLLKDTQGLWVLCDDGTIWLRPSASTCETSDIEPAAWYQIPPVPQDAPPMKGDA